MTEHTTICNACDEPFSFDVPDTPLGQTLVRVRRRCDGCVQADRDHDEQERAERQELNDRQQFARRLKAAELPKRMPAQFDERTGEAWALARAWADGKIDSLFLFGPVGTGKTTMAACALRERLTRRAGFWRPVPVLLSHLGMGFGNAKHDQALELLDGSYMLGLDDLDKGRPTAYVGQHVFAAIDGCYSNRTPLVVTSNVGLDAIAEHWEDHGDAIASRLVEGTVVFVDGDDRRLRVAA